MDGMKKTIVVVGVTGNQGGSVARRFKKDSNYHVRGITRNSDSQAAQELASEGIEIVAADLNDVTTLIPAFKNANVIFSVTNYWESFFRPDCRAIATQEGISYARYAYGVETQHGKNIADAAATTVDTLDTNGFIASTMSHGTRCSKGKFQDLYHFNAKAEVFPDYVEQKYPALAAKASYILTGCYLTNHTRSMRPYWQKTSDGTVELRLTTSPDALVPHLAPAEDIGTFVYAASQMPPGNFYVVAGTICSWTEFMATWSKVTGVPARYVQVDRDEMVVNSPDPAGGRELEMMFNYFTDPGHLGGMDVLGAQDLKKAGIACPVTTVEEFMKKQDWSGIISQ